MNLTVLNGAEGINGMLGSIMSNAGTFLPGLMAALRANKPVEQSASTEFKPAATTSNGKTDKIDA